MVLAFNVTLACTRIILGIGISRSYVCLPSCSNRYWLSVYLAAATDIDCKTCNYNKLNQRNLNKTNTNIIRKKNKTTQTAVQRIISRSSDSSSSSSSCSISNNDINSYGDDKLSIKVHVAIIWRIVVIYLSDCITKYCFASDWTMLT